MINLKDLVERIRKELSQEINVFSKDLETLSEFSKSFGSFASDFETAQKLKSGLIKYKLGSLFLKECAEYLNSSPNEVIHLVTGVEIEDRFYLMDKMEKVRFQANSVGAKADISDLFSRLIEMDEDYGHLLLGIFHSHPFHGPAGTQPSGIDRHLQEILEDSGYQTIQAIFSRDGFIRFFSNKTNFEILIYGKGLQKLEGGKDHEAVFRLVNFQK